MLLVCMHHHLGQREMDTGPVFYCAHKPTKSAWCKCSSDLQRSGANKTCYLLQFDASRVKDILTDLAILGRNPLRRNLINLRVQCKDAILDSNAKMRTFLNLSNCWKKAESYLRYFETMLKETLLYMQRQVCVHVYHLFETFKHIFCLLYCYAFNISKLKNVSSFLFTIILHVLHFSFQEIVRLRYGQCCIGGCFRDFSKNSRCRVSCAEIQSVRQGHW